MATKTANGAAKNGTLEAAGPSIVLRPLDLQTAEVPIAGLSELITHRWSEKARRMMLEAQQSKTRPKKQPKDPQQDYEESIYRLPSGEPGFPAVAFKSAIVTACRLFEGLPMTQAKVAIRVLGEGPEQLVPITSEGPHMREDMVRLESGVADIRYRAGFWPWSALLYVQFNANLIGLESLVHLVNAAGQGGVGEWRPSAPKSFTGSYGTFEVQR